MTYEQLLEKVTVNALVSPNALRLVVELHKPLKVNDLLLCACEPIQYPCPTIETIEKELQ
jgi:hypothetical protein